jgi:hypothetical protein
VDNFHGPIVEGNFRVMRNCCTSGNCIDCNGKTPVGVPMRVMQFEKVSKETAEGIAGNWTAYRATVEPMPDLTTVKKVQTALRKYRRDQLAVILQMADNRGLDRDNLTLADYDALIREEAESDGPEYASEAWATTSEERRGQIEYFRSLTMIANRIVVGEAKRSQPLQKQ